MKVLVTGGAGFIGSTIVDLLIENNYDVCVIDSLIHGKKSNINPKAVFYNIDIRSKDIQKIFAKEKPEILIHEAAQINVSNSISNPRFDADVNIIGTINLLEAAKKTGVKKVIYPASAAIFGEPKYLPIDEKHPLEMLSCYGASKHTVEHYLDIYYKLYNINYTVLIYSNVYGPRQDSSGEGGVIAIFCESVLNNISPFIYGDGKQTRDFVYVKDIAKANLLSLKLEKNAIYNVSTNTAITINEVLDKINFLCNKHISPIYCKKRDSDIINSYMSYDKLSLDLHWKPEYSLISGLTETLEFYKSRNL